MLETYGEREAFRKLETKSQCELKFHVGDGGVSVNQGAQVGNDS